MQEENLKINISTEKDIVTILTGQAPPEKIRGPININGTIGAPGEFVRNLQPHLKDSFAVSVSVDYVAREIELVNYWLDKTDWITGTLINPKLVTDLGINQSNVLYTAEELANLLRKYKPLFKKDRYVNDLIGQLRSIRTSVTRKFEERTNLGDENMKRDIETIVENSVTINEFELMLPIFQNEEPEAILINLFTKVTGKTLSFYLDSIDLANKQDAAAKKLIDAEVAKSFGPDSGIPVFYSN